MISGNFVAKVDLFRLFLLLYLTPGLGGRVGRLGLLWKCHVQHGICRGPSGLCSWEIGGVVYGMKMGLCLYFVRHGYLILRLWTSVFCVWHLSVKLHVKGFCVSLD